MSQLSRIRKACTTAIAVAVVASPAALAATNWSVAVGDSHGSAQHELGLKFQEVLAAKTNGEYTVELFLNGQLGDEQATVNDAAMGTLDFSLVAINNITPFSPSVGVFSLPYVILSLEEAVTLTQGEIGQELVENTVRDAGVRIVGWTYTGFRRLTNSKKPVKTPADLKGLVIRVPKNEIMINTYNAWGLNPTPMAWSETFTALQQKVVDGQDNPYLTINAMKFYEVQKYVTNIRYIFSIEPLIVSEALFQDQDEEVQKAILEAGMEATQHSAQFLADSEEAIREELLAKGMVIDEPADNEKEWIELATAAVWPASYDQIGGKEKLDAVLKAVGRSAE
jgi:tripartite ATP-independent transporter DctP family solute receptor